MLVAVRRPRINVRVTGVGARIVVQCLRKMYGLVEVSQEDEAGDITTAAWWKRMQAVSHKGTALWAYRDNAGHTLSRLSKLSGIAVPHLSAMENGKRTIGVRSAKKLAEALKVDYRLFL